MSLGLATLRCTRESKFEINEQGDCGTRGLGSTGFVAVDLSSAGKPLRCNAVMSIVVPATRLRQGFAGVEVLGPPKL